MADLLSITYQYNKVNSVAMLTSEIIPDQKCALALEIIVKDAIIKEVIACFQMVQGQVYGGQGWFTQCKATERILWRGRSPSTKGLSYHKVIDNF